MATPDAGTLELARQRDVSAEELLRRADWIRLQTLALIGEAGLGHYSSTLSCAEILATLFYRTLRLRPANPTWTERDRFLLGKGHVAVGLWPVLADLAFFPADWLHQFGQLDSPLTDHPNMRLAPGIDFSSGSLGHNLSVGVGMALGARFRHSDHRTFVLLGDGELHEGQVWEAAMAASHYKLGSLVAIVDANGSCGDGETSAVMNIEPIAGRFSAFGWRTVELNGHDTKALISVLDGLPDPTDSVPTCIVARTQKGKGVSFMELAPRDWHLGHLGPQDQQRAAAEIERRLA